jgi:hypothetical protein
VLDGQEGGSLGMYLILALSTLNPTTLKCKVSRCNSATYLNWTLIFELSEVRCGFKYGHQKGIACSKEIALCSQNLLTMLG